MVALSDCTFQNLISEAQRLFLTDFSTYTNENVGLKLCPITGEVLKSRWFFEPKLNFVRTGEGWCGSGSIPPCRHVY